MGHVISIPPYNVPTNIYSNTHKNGKTFCHSYIYIPQTVFRITENNVCISTMRKRAFASDIVRRIPILQGKDVVNNEQKSFITLFFSRLNELSL